MPTRITNGYLTNQSVFYLRNNLGLMSSLQEKLSSGKNINQPSDDPVGLTRILNINNNLSIDDRYKQSIADGISEVNAADSAIDSLVQLVQRTQELTTQAANFTNNQTGRDAIATEINQIMDQMVQIGNTEVGGRYIFGGFKTASPPFTRASQFQINYTGTPTTEPWQRQINISQGISMTVNINGSNLLGTANGAAGALPAVVAGTGLFQTMTKLLIDLQQAGDPAQLTEIRARLDDLTANLQTVSANQSVLGAVSNRLDLTKDRLDTRGTILTQEFAGIQNIDQAKTIADLNYQQNIFQSSLAVTGRLLQTSLLNYLS